jgi:hypothetical protein
VVVECDSLIYGYVVESRNWVLRPLIESAGVTRAKGGVALSIRSKATGVYNALYFAI